MKHQCGDQEKHVRHSPGPVEAHIRRELAENLVESGPAGVMLVPVNWVATLLAVIDQERDMGEDLWIDLRDNEDLYPCAHVLEDGTVAGWPVVCIACGKSWRRRPRAARPAL